MQNCAEKSEVRLRNVRTNLLHCLLQKRLHRGTRKIQGSRKIVGSKDTQRCVKVVNVKVEFLHHNWKSIVDWADNVPCLLYLDRLAIDNKSTLVDSPVV